MALREVIAALESADQDYVAPIGFGEPMSYRGDYGQLAFEPARNVSVASMLKHAKSALNQTFTGYKGGDFLMDQWVDCYIAEYSHSTPNADLIGPVLLAYLTGRTAPESKDE